MFAGEPQPDQDDHLAATDPLDRLETLLGGARLGDDLHVGPVVDQQPESGADDR